MSEVADLISSLGAASEGSADLDRQIEAYLFPQHRTLILRDKWTCPPRSRSFEAALTLMPTGFSWTLRHFWNHPWAVSFVFLAFSPQDEPMFEAYAKTPALAACIAALKARHDQEGPRVSVL